MRQSFQASDGERLDVAVEVSVNADRQFVWLPAFLLLPGVGSYGTNKAQVRYADGRRREVPWVTDRFIEILGRQMSCDALGEAEGTTPLIGQIPLEALDLVVNPKTGDLMPDPESPDAPLLDILRVAQDRQTGNRSARRCGRRGSAGGARAGGP